MRFGVGEFGMEGQGVLPAGAGFLVGAGGVLGMAQVASLCRPRWWWA
ncbi:hypothetical protein [Streptomyces shenzhenensis]